MDADKAILNGVQRCGDRLFLIGIDFDIKLEKFNIAKL